MAEPAVGEINRFKDVWWKSINNSTSQLSARGTNILSELSRFTLGGDTSAIGGVAWSQGTHLLEQGGAGQGTQLAVAAPASAPVAATLRLGHQVPATGGHLTQVGQDFGEAEAFSVVCRVETKRRADPLEKGGDQGSWSLEQDNAQCCIAKAESCTSWQSRPFYSESSRRLQKVWTDKRQLKLHQMNCVILCSPCQPGSKSPTFLPVQVS